MTAAIIVYVLIVTVPLIGAAALAERAFRLWSLPVRGAWAVTALLIVLIGGRAVAHQVVAPAAVATVTSISLPSLKQAPEGRLTGVTSVARELISLPRSAATYVAHVVGPTPNRLLAILWGVMSAIVFALICLVYARVWHARRVWSVTEFAGYRVRVASHAGPAVIGLFRPEIVVPRWVLESQPEDGKLIIMHEMEHRTARDPLLLAAMWGLVALIPWHPGAWYCLARTRLAIELDCDARVITRGASLRTYTQLLVNLARVRLGAPMHLWLGATSLLEPSSHLERRLNAMIVPYDSSKAPRPVPRFLRTLSYFAVVATIAVVACESHAPTAADISGLDATSAEKNARQTGVIGGQPTAYYVNGSQVSMDSARTVQASNISSIAVVKPNKTSAQQEIRITTIGAPITGDSTRALHMMTVTVSPVGTMVRPYGTPSSRTFHVTMPAGGRRVQNPVAITIDGVPSNAAAMDALNPNDIASVDVIKGPAALRESTDPLAKNGLIRITLKH